MSNTYWRYLLKVSSYTTFLWETSKNELQSKNGKTKPGHLGGFSKLQTDNPNISLIK